MKHKNIFTSFRRTPVGVVRAQPANISGIARNAPTIIAIIILLVLGPLVYFRLIKPNLSSAAWFNDMWAYRKAITFNNSGAAVTNQKVKLDVNTATAVDPQTTNFNTADLTFTPNVAKRNSTTGTSAPFAAGIMVSGNADSTGTADSISVGTSSQINGNFYQNFDSNQGSIAFWITPEWNGTDNLKHYFFDTTNSTTFSLYKDTDNKLYFALGSSSVSVGISSWTAGNTYNIVTRWDTRNTLDGNNHASISIGGTGTFGITSAPSVSTPGSNFYLGTNTSNQFPANAEFEGLTIYRRPLYTLGVGNTTPSGINLGNGDEIRTMVGGGASDPTLATGSWDVVFDLPTNSSTGSLGVGGTGQAWSHPHSSNVLYTSTTNTGGFMMNGTYTTDGWTTRNNGGTAPSVAALSSAQKIYAGGYAVTSDGATTSQGIGSSASIAVGSTGQNYVVRVLANSDGTSIPQVQIWDLTNNAQITSLTGTVGSGRTAPDTMLFTFELPTIYRNGAVSNCTSFDVRLVNTQATGAVYWHQVELLTNLIDNPSLDTGASDPWIPTSWSNSGLTAGQGVGDTGVFHSGTSSFKCVNADNQGITRTYTNATGGYFSSGVWGNFSSGTKIVRSTNGYEVPQTGNSTWATLSSWNSSDSGWKHKSGVTRGTRSGTQDPFRLICGSNGGATGYFDDAYYLQLSPVSLTITPASLANSTESTGIRVDGRDTATASITNLTTTTGTIKFQYTPRHASSISNKFVESGIGTTDPAYIADFSGDSDDYIKLYWKTNNTLLLKYSMNGTGASAQTTALSLGAGTSYPMTLTYLGGGTMALNVGISTNAIALTAIPSAFGTAPSTAYWGTDSTGAYQGDATYAATAVTTGVKMQNDCDDVRFTDQNGNLLDYYYDSTNGICNAESTDFYVLMPSINTGHNTVYMYYGNSSATKGSKTSNFSQTTFSQSSTTTATEELSKGPIAYWAMDEGQGTILNNSGSFGNNSGSFGSGTSAPTWATEDMCISGKCLKFDGNDFVSIGSTARDVMSISLWVRPATTAPTIIDLDGGTHYISASNTTVSATGFSTPTIYVNGRSNGTLTANNWNHIEVTTATSFNATSISLGKRTTNFLTGFMDEVKIYAYARTVAEIKADFNSRGTPKGESAGIRSKSAQIGSIPDPLANGLVGYWKMDEASWNGTANEVIDSSGNSNHGIGVGATKPTTGAGKFGNGGVFDGINNYGNLGNPTSLQNFNQMTISAWINADTLSATSFNMILSKNSSGYYLTIYQQKICFRSTDLSIGSIITGTTTVTTGTWHHIAATYDGSGVTLYLDGSKDRYIAATGTISENATDINIGAFTSNQLYFDGTLDEVRIYNRALSPAEVRNLYDWAPGPVAYYNFNEGVGTSAYDTSGSGSNGVLGTGSSAPIWTTGKYGKAIKFDGVNDYIDAGTAPSLNFGTGDFTLQSWIKFPLSGSNQWNNIIGKGEDVSAYANTWWLANYNGSASLVYQDSVDAGGSYNGYYIFTAASLTSGWHHITVTRSNGTAYKFYIDAKQDGLQTSPQTANLTNTRNLRFGKGYDARYVNATLDEVKIYNYARTQKQIVEDMNAGHPAGGSPVGSQVAKYSFDEGYGSVVRDSGAFGNNSGSFGSGASAPSWSNDGKFGKALSFDGSGDYAYTANTAMMAGNGQTYPTLAISAWVYPQSSAASKTILNKNKEFKLTTDANSKVNCSIGIGGTVWSTAAVSSSALALNSWTHVLCNYDGANIKVWTNGTNGSNATNIGSSAQIVSLNTTPLNIGKDATTLANYQGLIDEVKIYNYSLSQDEILTDFNSGSALVMGSLSTGSSNPAPVGAGSQEYCIPGDTTTNCSPPVGRWSFNEGVGTSAYDTSGNGLNGVLGTGSSAPTWTKGKIGKALSFDGVNDLVTVGNISSILNLQSATPPSFTMSGWFYCPVLASCEYGGVKLMATNGARLLYTADYGLPKYFFQLKTAGTVAGSQSAISPNTWYYLVGVYDKDANLIKFYQNGVLQSQATPTSVDLSGYTMNVIIGNAQSYFKGLIDQVRIYSYARTPAQIAWDYNKGAPIAYYDFNDCQGTTARDAGGVDDKSATRYDATINIGSLGTQSSVGTCALGIGTSTAWGIGATGKYGASINLDGTDDYIVGSTAAMMAGTGQSYGGVSWGAWLNPVSVGNTATIINKSNEFKLELNPSSKPMCNVYIGGAWKTAAVSSTAIANAAWSHVLCTYDGTNIKVYVNTINNGTQAQTTSLVSLGTTALNIARDPASSQYFNGKIDEVKLWNYPLTSVQIKNEFNQSSGVRFGE